MSYQPGHMGVAEGIALIFATTLSPVFLSVYPFSVRITGPLVWLVPVTTYFESLFLLYMLLYVMRHTSSDLHSACQVLLGRWGARLIALFYIGLYFLDAGLLLRQFAENTLITALPALEFEGAVIVFALMAVLLLFIGIEAVAQTGYILMPFLIIGLVSTMALASSRYNFLFLTPWNGTGVGTAVTRGLLAGGLNLGALLPFFLAVSFQNLRAVRNSVLYGLGISCLLRTLAYTCYTVAFGVGSGSEKLLPFYELARLVYLSRFFQRIEAFFIIVWAVMGMINIAIDIFAGLYLLSRMFNLPALRPLIVPVAVIIAELAILPSAVTDAVFFYIQGLFGYYNIGTFVIPLMLFVAALIHARRRKKTCRAA